MRINVYFLVCICKRTHLIAVPGSLQQILATRHPKSKAWITAWPGKKGCLRKQPNNSYMQVQSSFEQRDDAPLCLHGSYISLAVVNEGDIP
jgi:hypothetical protein